MGPKGSQTGSVGKPMGTNRMLRKELNGPITTKNTADVKFKSTVAVRGDHEFGLTSSFPKMGGDKFSAGVAALARCGTHGGGQTSSHDGGSNTSSGYPSDLPRAGRYGGRS